MIKFTQEQTQNIIDLYVKKRLSAKTIAPLFNTSHYTILRHLRRNGVAIRDMTACHKKYTIDETFFEKIDSEDKAYFLGFMFADGYNNTEKGEARLKLHVKDKKILEYFTECLSSNKPLRFDRSYIYLALENQKLSADLARHGCVKAKTHIIKFPDLNDDLVKHFIRGYFDGDGCITWSKNNPIVSITSTNDFLTKIQRILMNELGLSKTKFTKRHKNRSDFIMTMNYGGMFNCKKIYNYLYRDANVFLERKKQKFNEKNTFG